MISWYLQCRKLVEQIGAKAFDCLEAYRLEKEDRVKQIAVYAREDAQRLEQLWSEHTPSGLPSNLFRHLHFAYENDFRDIIRLDLPAINEKLDEVLNWWHKEKGDFGFEDLLDPIISDSSYAQFKDGHLRSAVLDSLTGLFDYIRGSTGLTLDGDALVGHALSVENPALILSEIDSESGKNDQRGFMKIFQGAFQGIRNPKAHSLNHDLTRQEAAQYLIFASLLARRVREAKRGPAFKASTCC